MPVFTVEGYCCKFTTFQLYSALFYIPSEEFYKNFQSHDSTIFNIMNQTNANRSQHETSDKSKWKHRKDSIKNLHANACV